MIGDYVLHFPITDFAVSLLVIAALIDVGRLALRRPQWTAAVDLLAFLGFGGALAAVRRSPRRAVATGWWLASAQDHGDSRTLSIHHWLAYGTLGVSAVAVAARLFEARVRKLAAVRTTALLVAAGLVSGAGFFGGRMAHGGDAHAHPTETGATTTDHAKTPPHDHDEPPTPDPERPAHPSTPHAH